MNLKNIVIAGCIWMATACTNTDRTQSDTSNKIKQTFQIDQKDIIKKLEEIGKKSENLRNNPNLKREFPEQYQGYGFISDSFTKNDLSAMALVSQAKEMKKKIENESAIGENLKILVFGNGFMIDITEFDISGGGQNVFHLEEYETNSDYIQGTHRLIYWKK